MKKFFATILAVTVFFLTGCGEVQKSSAEKNSLPAVEEKNLQTETSKEKVSLKIKIKIGEKIFDATLEDNPSTQEFLKNLPLEMTMNELNGNEKYFRFTKNFPSNDSHVGKIHTGDLMLYGSNTLVLFYEDFSTIYSYTRLGKIDNPKNLSEVVGDGNIKIHFEK